MHKYLFLTIIFSMSISHAYSLTPIKPKLIQDFHTIITHDVYTGPQDYHPSAEPLNIYNLSIDDHNLYCMVGAYMDLSYAEHFFQLFVLKHFGIYRININSKEVSFISSKETIPPISNIENTYDSIIWPDGTETTLENSCKIYTYLLEEEIEITHSLIKLAIQEEEDSSRLIAGLIRWTTCESSSSIRNKSCKREYTLNFWNYEGKQVLNKKFHSPHPWFEENYKQFDGAPDVTEIRFTKNNRFLLFNLSGEVTRKEYLDDDYVYLLPYSFLVDTETFEFLSANRDVAFSSDERYYVTEREGMPSLVDAQTHEVLQQFDPGAIMSACCFSPDDRYIYMACDDLKIYVFDREDRSSAGIPWEVLE